MIVLVLLDNNGGIWMGGNRGLSRIVRREVEEVFEGRRAKLGSQAFGLDDGLLNVEINGSGSSGWNDPDGRLWFATRGGVASVDPSRLWPNLVPPPVVIEEVLADEHPLPAGGGWQLAPGTRRLTFGFTALGLRSPSRVRLRHRLDGFDTDWVGPGTSRTADYTNLSHGRYSFRVAAANEDGVWNEKGSEVGFEIEPRFHETTLFRVVAVAFFVFVVPLFHRVRLRRLEGKRAELERIVEERTAEVRAANERLAQLSREDPLTGLANRRRLDEVLDEEWRRAARQGTSLGFLLVDVDFFKAYNDQLGHLAGDTCLKAVAEAVAEVHRRAGELVARYGGEEFAILVPGVLQSDLRSVGEALRQRVETLALPNPGSIVAPAVTVSVGFAWAEPRDDGTPADLVGAADRALYQAKNRGRNRVEGADTP